MMLDFFAGVPVESVTLINFNGVAAPPIPSRPLSPAQGPSPSAPVSVPVSGGTRGKHFPTGVVAGGPPFYLVS
jgi:hypothetical protein